MALRFRMWLNTARGWTPGQVLPARQPRRQRAAKLELLPVTTFIRRGAVLPARAAPGGTKFRLTLTYVHCTYTSEERGDGCSPPI